MNADCKDWPRMLRKRAREIERTGESVCEVDQAVSWDAFHWFWLLIYAEASPRDVGLLTAHECALLLYLAAEVLESGDY